MYDFKLTPAYCLFNGAAVMEQRGAEILILVENYEDVVLQGRLKRAFLTYLEIVKKLGDCPDNYKTEPIVRFIKGSRDQLRRCVSGLYKADEKEREEMCLEDSRKEKEAAAVLLLDSILHDARDKKATDIHIEKNCVRFRINGVLENQLELMEERSLELVQRIKLLAGMNVIEKHRSQDGRFVYGNTNPIFVRVSTVSVVGKRLEGEESVVLRLLDTSRIPLSLQLLGFNENQLKEIQTIETLKNGLVLVCGPTGAGKSTTVASVLVEMERRTKGRLKIISLEDPPEYIIPGVTQIRVDEEHSNSFNELLGHVFRQDPDVIMIGEIRDEISAAVALRGALTGHLVFATVHTSGPGEAVLRMENLGIERKILASVLKSVICQDLEYMGEKVSLCADVALPKVKFGTAVGRQMSEEELDELFVHVTNYSEIFKKTVENWKKKDSKQRQIWIGGAYGQKVHKNIG